MSRKEIQIETNFYNDDNTELFKAQLIEKSQLTAKSASSALRKSEPDASINSYRYEYVPDNEYSHYVGLEKDEAEHFDNLPNVQKLQAAYQLETFLSRIAAGLFISCWETLKGLLTQQRYSQRKAQLQATYLNLKNEEVLKDFSNNQKRANTYVESKQETNQFSQEIQSGEQRKMQIIERQKRGITLDSLQKQRQLSKIKQISKVIPQKDMNTLQNNSLAKQKAEAELQNAHTSMLHRDQQTSQISRKSYREKFEEYKNRKQSKEQRDMMMGQNSNNETREFGQQNNVGTWEYIIGHQDSSHNYTNTKNQFSKSPYLHNTLYDSYNYSKHIPSYPYANFTHYNQLFSYKSPLATNLNSARSNYHIEQNVNQVFLKRQQLTNLEKLKQQEQIVAEHEWIRAKLIQEITEKLSFSRLRLQTRYYRNFQDLEMIRKIARLQKLVMELKKQQHGLKNSQQSHYDEQTLLKKFMQQLSSIRQQLNELKLHQKPHFSQDDSARIISQQQLLLNNYQLEQQKLSREQDQSEFKHEPAKNFSQSRIGQKVVYRKVLFDGKHQAYEYEQRELREQEIRKMTERVRKMRGEQVTIVDQKRNATDQYRSLRPIRQTYENQLERLQKQRKQLRQEDDNCCVLIKY